MKKYSLSILSVAFLFSGVLYSQSKSPVHFITEKTPVGFESEINAFLRQDSVIDKFLHIKLFIGISQGKYRKF